MHNHNNNDGMKSMMWMMIICCAVPLLLILVAGAEGKALGAPTWIVLGIVAVMIVAHFFMMKKSHNHTDKEQKDNKDQSGHSCH